MASKYSLSTPINIPAPVKNPCSPSSGLQILSIDFQQNLFSCKRQQCQGHWSCLSRGQGQSPVQVGPAPFRLRKEISRSSNGERDLILMRLERRMTLTIQCISFNKQKNQNPWKETVTAETDWIKSTKFGLNQYISFVHFCFILWSKYLNEGV